MSQPMVKPSEYHVQRRPDGAVVVRVVSRGREQAPPLQTPSSAFKSATPARLWANKLRTAQSETVQCFE